MGFNNNSIMESQEFVDNHVVYVLYRQEREKIFLYVGPENKKKILNNSNPLFFI